ncbi:MAG: hypothetical protein JKY43_03255 [Phycisphaerales bacterium]|nr:hypothetical protein [Phycisphaerales bacterium]
MKKENQKFRNLVQSLEPGESITILSTPEEIKEICMDINVRIFFKDNDLFTVKCMEIEKKSKAKEIKSILSDYKRESVAVDYDSAYVRLVVSNWNKKHSDSFKVHVERGVVYVFKQFEDWIEITQDEFDEWSSSMKEKFDLMQSKIVVNNEIQNIEFEDDEMI